MKTTLLLAACICTAMFVNAQNPSASNTLGSSGITSIASTTNAAFKLSVNGTAKHYGTGDGTGVVATMVTSPTIFLQNTTASTGRQYSINSNNSGLFRIADAITASPFTATDRFVINSTGLIGVGNSAPTARLHITGSGATSATTSFLIQNSAAANLLTVADDGNTGIGMSPSTSYKLSVNSNIQVNGIMVGRGLLNVSANTAVGVNALSLATGIDNTATGYGALQNNTTAYANTANGWHSMYSNTTGRYNAAYGYQSLSSNTTADRNTALGYNAMSFSVSGAWNTAVGFGALSSNTTGSYNTGVGYEPMFSITSGSNNVALGLHSGYNITTGSQNIFLGYNCGYGVSTGNYNTIIGSQITGLAAGLSNTIILADGQGNQRMFINASGQTGLGTLTPNNTLEINQGTAGNSGLRFTNLTSSSTAASSSGKVLSVNVNGDVVLETGGGGGSPDGSETKVTAGANISVTGTGTIATPYVITGNAGTSYWNSAPLGTGNIINSNVGSVIIGTGITTLPAGYKLYVSDGILAEKVKVALKSGANWADYVFDQDYKLAPLGVVETYLLKHGHLPGIPSAKKLVEEGGIDVNQMFAMQMKKIEELTLYLIQVNKKLKSLEKENKILKASLPALRK